MATTRIKYEFIDGETTEVDVPENIGAFIVESRRKESNLNRKERYHAGYYIDGNDTGKERLIDNDTPEAALLREELSESINAALSLLSEKQCRRLLLYSNGVSMREIARRENVGHKDVRESIEQARKKLKKFF